MNLSAAQQLQETRVWSLGWEDPMEEGMTTHTSIIAWRISWIEKRGRLQSIGSQRVGHTCPSGARGGYISRLLKLLNPAGDWGYPLWTALMSPTPPFLKYVTHAMMY